MKKILAILLSVIMIMSTTACGADTGGNSEQPQSSMMENNSSDASDEENIDMETMQAIKDFDDFNLLDIHDGIIKNDDYFIITEYEIQNRSAEFILSNLYYEFAIIDSKGEIKPVKDEIVQKDIYLLRLEPRKKADLQMMTHAGDNEEHSEWGHYIVKYSYDMDGSRYTVDLVNKLGYKEEIKNNSNVNFEEKNIIKFNDESTSQTVYGKNISDEVIRTLSAQLMVFDSEGKITDVESEEYFGLGEQTLEPGKEYPFSVDRITANEDGHLEVVSYTYDLSEVDENGFNHFEVNLLTGECIGTTNSFALNINVDIDVEELQPYIAALGKKIGETNLDVESIKEGSSNGVSDQIRIKNVSTIFNLPGEFVIYRDYDSLLIDSFKFEAAAEDEETKNYIMNALKKTFGEDYQMVKYGYKSGEYVVWEEEGFEVEFSWDYGLDVRVGIITEE